MRRALPAALGLLVIAGVVVASVIWFRDHEGDGRSDYERLIGDENAAPAASLACFPRPPDERAIGELNQNSDSDDALVPGEPTRLLLCRYWGMNYGNGSLSLAARRLVTNQATVRLVADGLNDLPPFPDGAISCPSDEGARTYALFVDHDHPQVVVELRFEGCPAARNGRAEGARLGDPVARQVMNLVPLPSGPRVGER
jgi:hypothetical protein